MMRSRSRLQEQAITLFLKACDYPIEEQREFLTDQCTGDIELYRLALELMEADTETAGPLAPYKALDEESNADLSLIELIDQLRSNQREHSRYSEGREVARDEVGILREVWDNDLDRTVRMKVMHKRVIDVAEDDESPLASEEEGRRFWNEVKISGKLDHPSFVPVHDVGLLADGRMFFTMRLVQGQTLLEVLRLERGGLAEWTQLRVVEIILRVCEAIAHAHSRDLIHSNLQPANVIVGRHGQVYVLELGGAKALEKVADPGGGSTGGGRGQAHALHAELLISEEPTVAGRSRAARATAYMPPEQAGGDGEGVGRGADVYSIGAMLYTLLGGRAPYAQIGSQRPAPAMGPLVVKGPPTALRKIAPGDLPFELEAITEKAMAREIGDRYSSVPALAEDLRAFVEGRAVKACGWYRRIRVFSPSGFLTVFLILLGLVFAMFLLTVRGEEDGTRVANGGRDTAFRSP